MRKRRVDRGGIRERDDVEVDEVVVTETIVEVAPMKLKYPRKLLTLQNLQGGQFGMINVTAVSDALIELDFGPDYDRLSPMAARSLIEALATWLDQIPPTKAPPAAGEVIE